MDWLQIFVNLTLTGILLYVFQRVIDERSAKRLEKFKAELQSTSFEKEVRFSKLHERRAEVVEEIYRKLLKVHSALIVLKLDLQSTALKPDINNKTWETYETIKEFRNYFDENKLFLPEPLCDKIGILHRDALKTHLNLLSASGNKDLAGHDKVQNERYWDDLAKASDILADNVAPLIKEIEKEFRSLLGNQ